MRKPLHSKLPPSSAARRVACPGSRDLEERYPREDSDASREGTLAHEVAASVLLADGKTIENTTADMLSGAVLYAETINRDLNFNGNPILHVEERVDISTIHPECFGTPDAWFYAGRELFLYDYKFGHGAVEVYENWQLIEYAAGILTGLDASYVTFTIVQPRAYHRDKQVRTWRATRAHLNHLFNILRDAEEKAWTTHADTAVSAQCTHCSARHACMSLQLAAGTIADFAQINIPFNLKSEQLGNELRWLHDAQQLLEARITGLEAQATAMIRRGDRVPHYTLENGRGAVIWTREDEEIANLGDMYGFNIRKLDVITPTQAIALGIPKQIVSMYSDRIEGKAKLTRLKLKGVFDAIRGST